MVSLDAQILALVSDAVRDAAEEARREIQTRRDFMDAEECADYLKRTPEAFKKIAPRVPRVSVEGKWLYPRDEVYEWANPRREVS